MGYAVEIIDLIYFTINITTYRLLLNIARETDMQLSFILIMIYGNLSNVSFILIMI